MITIDDKPERNPPQPGIDHGRLVVPNVVDTALFGRTRSIQFTFRGKSHLHTHERWSFVGLLREG